VAACTSSLDLDAEEPSSVIGVQMLGSVRTALDAVDLVDAEVVVVASHSEMTGPELRRLSWGLESRNVDLVVSPGIIEVAGPRLSIRPAAGLSLLHVERPTVDGGRLLGKIIFDRVMSVLISLLILPVALVVALAIKVDSRGPVFFRQDRIGARGEPFEMFKFRSMVVDAEARLADVSAQGNDGNGVLFKQRNDPRVTRVGQFIRRYSLDELPQLINVLKGDMSLVGPRPPLRSEVEGYEPDAVRRLRVRPGLTGLWQVSGRSDLSWDESLRLDLRYVDNWSMILDLQILWRTARAVLRGSGAY
jgi:exopolysaccharide biosynthesis polyprenyl glycosylphosphotransferase